MRIVQYAAIVGLACASAGVVAAQDAAELLRQADRRVAAKDWTAALELLLRVDGEDRDRDQHAGLLTATGNGLIASGQFEVAARAWVSAAAAYGALHGGADHAAVAVSLNNAGFCLQALGRVDEALPQYEQALAMLQRLHTNDHADVAGGLANAAACLEELGRIGEALPRYEQALAMRERLGGDADDGLVASNLERVACCLQALRRGTEALPRFEAVLAMQRRLHGDVDDPAVARSISNVATCLWWLGRDGEALPLWEQTVAMYRRLRGDDHADVAAAIVNQALCLQSFGRTHAALPLFEAAAATYRRLLGEADHALVATSLGNVATCLERLGRAGEALPLFEQGLAMRRRLHGEADHPDVATSLDDLGRCLGTLGRGGEALSCCEQALAMRKRRHGDADHADVAASANNLGSCLLSLGRSVEALPRLESALAMWSRLHGDADAPDVARALANVAACLESLGRAAEALPQFEQALAMWRRRCGDADHPDVALGLNYVAGCLRGLGRVQEALPHYQQALALLQRLHGEHAHPDVALCLNDLAVCLAQSGRAGDALPRLEEVLAMQRRLYGDVDHPDIATGLNNVAACLEALGRSDEALQRHERVLAMRKRLFGEADHGEVATSLTNVASCLQSVGRPSEALPQHEQALGMWQRLFGDADHPQVALALNNVACCLQALDRSAEALPRAARACDMIERLRDESRISAGLKQSFFDAMKLGDAFERLHVLEAKAGNTAGSLAAIERSRGRELLDLVEQQRFDALEEAERRAQQRGDDPTAARLRALRAELETTDLEGDSLLVQLTRLDDERPAAGPAHDEQAARRAGLQAHASTVQQQRRRLQDERARLLGDVLPVGRVRTASEIQASLQPGELLLEFTVTELTCCLHVVARGGVEIVPLPAAFATAARTLPVVLANCSRESLGERRGRDPAGASAATDAVACARELHASLFPSAVWERIRQSRRVFVAAHRELHRLPFEVLVADVRDGKPVYWLDVGPPVSYVASGSALTWLRKRGKEAVDDATSLDLLAIGDTRASAPGSSNRWPPLRGARAETVGIEAVFAARGKVAKGLLGADALEPAVFEWGAKAKYLHFACHGVAEEYVGQSLSMLVLAEPAQVAPDDDGLLKLPDLLQRWRGRLSSCRLVVLSACGTNVGPTLRDEAPQALPLGFLFAGAPSVISSLWSVDDASTKELMTDFYGRLLAGESDALAAFTAAKKALRSRYADPFHWAPFLFLGSPQ